MSPRHYQLDPHEQDAIGAFLTPGTPTGYLGDPDYNRSWSILHEEPGQIVLEHWNHALVEVEVKDGLVAGHRIVLGDEAKALRGRLVGE